MMKKVMKVLIVMLMVVGIYNVPTLSVNAAPADPVNIPDTTFKACVNSYISGNSRDDIPTEGQMAAITALNCGLGGIKSIEGAQYLTGIQHLGLDSNEITDFSYLSGLTTLETLSVNSNGMTSLTDFSGLTNLTSLSARGNTISDISSLSGLVNLDVLDVSSNEISNISTLASLTSLTSVFLDDNQITDITSVGSLVNLVYVSFAHNQVSDISPLSSLTNLALDVDASNQVLNLTPIYSNDPTVKIADADLPSLIDVNGNNLTYDSNLEKTATHDEEVVKLEAKFADVFVINSSNPATSGAVGIDFSFTAVREALYLAPISIHSNDFAVNLSEIKALADSDFIAKAISYAAANEVASNNASVLVIDIISSVVFNSDEMNAIRNATEAGVYNLTFTASHNGETVSRTVQVTVTGEVTPTLPPGGNVSYAGVIMVSALALCVFRKKFVK